jgi:hypothetical protein
VLCVIIVQITSAPALTWGEVQLTVVAVGRGRGGTKPPVCADLGLSVCGAYARHEQRGAQNCEQEKTGHA